MAQTVSALKQEQVEVEHEHGKVSSKSKSRWKQRLLGGIGFPLGFLILVQNDGKSDAWILFALLMMIVSLVLLIVGLTGLGLSGKRKALDARLFQIKKELAGLG